MMETNDKPVSRKPFVKRLIVMLIIAVIVFGGLLAFDLFRVVMTKRFIAHFKQPPAVVSTSIAERKNWQLAIEAIGTVKAKNGVNVTTQVAGQVVAINFESGESITAGQLLVQLDDRTDQQDLKNYEAQTKLSELTYERQSKLLSSKSASQSDVDSARAQLDQNGAQVERTKVLIDQKAIKAPFSGQLGIRQVDLGQYLSPGDTIVTLQALDSVYVDFYLPERYLSQLKIDQPVEVNVDAFSDKTFTGKILAINSEVDDVTRNILVRASIPNPDHLLVPGMFGNVRILLPQKKDVVTVPQTAISYNLYGDIVYTVVQDEKNKDKDNQPQLKAVMHYVKVGEKQGNEVEITEGINPGDQVVISGQLKLDNNTPVAINNSVDVSKSVPLPSE